MKNDPRFWVWGYVLDQVPGKSYFLDGATSCSLETGAKYLGADNVFWLNPLHSQDAICDWQIERLQDFSTVFSG